MAASYGSIVVSNSESWEREKTKLGA
jgi:hypothetical protein